MSFVIVISVTSCSDWVFFYHPGLIASHLLLTSQLLELGAGGGKGGGGRRGEVKEGGAGDGVRVGWSREGEHWEIYITALRSVLIHRGIFFFLTRAIHTRYVAACESGGSASRPLQTR